MVINKLDIVIAFDTTGSMASRMHFDAMMAECDDAEMKEFFASYKVERDNIDT